MRGKVNGKRKQSLNYGITPAYTGKRLSNAMKLCEAEDHPRLCGEKTGFLQVPTVGRGSPPPMRGKGRVSVQCEMYHRDHPRLCGEKTKKIPKQRYFFHQPASFSFSLQYT